MQKWSLVILFFLVAPGCYLENDSASVQIPNRLPDAITDSGVFVYLESKNHDISSQHIMINFRQYVEFTWNEVQDCLGMFSDEPPAVIVVDDVNAFLSKYWVFPDEFKSGYAFYEENIVIIDNDYLFSPQVLGHEFIHEILHQNGVPEYLNSGHQPDYLWSCANF